MNTQLGATSFERRQMAGNRGLDLETREAGGSRKRKDRDVISAAHPDRDPIRSVLADVVPRPTMAMEGLPPQIQASGGNLLAGYLAHEFLTRGTLFGQHWDPAAAARPPVVEALHLPPPPADRPKEQEDRKTTTASSPPAAYAEVAYLLKGDGAGIPGVVNPTQLVRWLQM